MTLSASQAILKDFEKKLMTDVFRSIGNNVEIYKEAISSAQEKAMGTLSLTAVASTAALLSVATCVRSIKNAGSSTPQVTVLDQMDVADATAHAIIFLYTMLTDNHFKNGDEMKVFHEKIAKTLVGVLPDKELNVTSIPE